MKFTIGAAIFSLASIAWFMAELTVQGDDKYSIIPVMILTTAALFQSCIVAWGVRYRGKRLEEDYRFGQTSSVINLGLSFLGTAAVFGGATVFLRAEISLHSYFQLGVVGFLFIVSWWNCHRVNKTPARHA